MNKEVISLSMKKIVTEIAKALVLLAFISPLCSKAQRIVIPLNEKINRSPIVIEGEIIYTKPGQLNKMAGKYMGEPFTRHFIKVYKVFKGNFEHKCIEVNTIGGISDDITVIAQDVTQLPGTGSTGLFFLDYSKDSTVNRQFSSECDTSSKLFHMEIVYSAYQYDLDEHKIENEVYRPIEALTGEKRRIIAQ